MSRLLTGTLLFLALLKFAFRDHCFDGILPTLAIVVSEHPLPHMINSQVHTRFQFKPRHGQTPSLEPMFLGVVDCYVFETIVVHYASDYVDLSM